METHDKKGTGRPRRENRKHARPGDSGQALPLPPRALRAPPPLQPPARDPHPAHDPAWCPRSSASTHSSPARGLGNTSHPVPRLPVAAALLLSEAGTCTPPLPGGAEFTTYFPTPSRGRGRASFSSDRRGGETQCHLANCPSYRFLGSQGRHWRHYLQQAGGGEGRGPKLS